MRNWFLSIEIICLFWAFSGCDRHVSNKQDQDPLPPNVEGVKPMVLSDTLSPEVKGVPERGGVIQPGSEDIQLKPNTTPREKPVVNPYNTKGPNQSKVDSIKAGKTEKKK